MKSFVVENYSTIFQNIIKTNLPRKRGTLVGVLMLEAINLKRKLRFVKANNLK